MDEYKVNGIVLGATDHKEKDILITILTAELGKIKAVLKGAKQPSAKFKVAGQPFCFAEWVLVKRGEFFVVTQVSVHDAFFDLTADYDKFLTASAMIEVCNYMLKPGIVNEGILINLLQALKLIVYDDVNNNLVCTKFMLEMLKLSGYGLNFDTCGVCNMPIAGDIVLSASTYEFCCVSCSGGYGKEVSKKIYGVLKIIDSTNYDKLQTIKEKPDVIFNSLNVVKFDIENILGFRIKSLN